MTLEEKVKLFWSQSQNPIWKELYEQDLKDFDAKDAYPGYPGMEVISHEYKQEQIDVVAYLIIAMTVACAKPEELVRAIKHSMVIMDAEKHQLDWKRSEQENDIRGLIEKYMEAPQPVRG